jgi:excisionase family DNA binding protein
MDRRLSVTITLPPDVLDEIVTEVTRRILDGLAASQSTSPWLSADQVAARLGWPTKRVRNLTTAHDLPCHRIGRRVLYNAAEIDEWVRSQ